MDNLASLPLTFNPQSLVLAAGTTSTLGGTGTFNFAIKGKMYQHAAWSTQAPPTSDIVTGNAFNRVGANTGCVFVIGIDAGGTMRVSQGPIVALDASGAFIQAPDFPPVPDTVCPVGYYIIKAGSTANATATGWLFGTSNSASVTGITYTLVNISTLPSRPQIA